MFKKVYPYLNLSFEVLLLVHNVAYLFDRTAAYRPWLNWIGIDIRRLGADDFVRHLVFVECITDAVVGLPPQEIVTRNQEDAATENPTVIAEIAAITAGIPATGATDRYILCALPRMVVLSTFACAVIGCLSTGPGDPSSQHFAAPSTGHQF